MDANQTQLKSVWDFMRSILRCGLRGGTLVYCELPDGSLLISEAGRVKHLDRDGREIPRQAEQLELFA